MYSTFFLSTLLNLIFTYLNTGEKIAATAYLYHKIGLAYKSSKSPINSSLTNDSNFKCIFISPIGLIIISSANNFKTCLYLPNDYGCDSNHSFIAYASYDI